MNRKRGPSRAKPANRAPRSNPLERIDRKARLRIPPPHVTKQPPFERVHNWDEVYYGYTPEPAMFEAQRCIQCPAAPCIKACPVDNDIPGALALLEIGKLAEAAAVFRSTSEMPELCGRLCPQESLCEGHCVVGKNNKPVAIGKLEAFLADWDRRQRGGFPVPAPDHESGARVAIVGSGPAGLAVAEALRADGHAITVFESWPKAGGVLRYGIPNFKSKKSIVDEKVDALAAAGVEFRCGVQVGADVTWDDLDAYDAVFLAHGAGLGKRLAIAGEDLAHVYSATDFLVRANLPDDALPAHQHGRPRTGDNVVVVGGGDTSMDCVRSAIRLGAKQVTLLYRRTENEMVGRDEERRHAREEGVKFEYLTTPVGFLAKDGKVVGVECVRMELGEPDASGRRRPSPIPGSEFVLDADSVVVAVGYDVDRTLLSPQSRIQVDDWGRVVVDEEGRTTRPGVFAAGDNVRGADLVVTALASAHQAIPTIQACVREATAARERARSAAPSAGSVVG
ncbi:MAG: NAD(P)-dependent oxidoreductase [Dehalococcoidia bacterium]